MSLTHCLKKRHSWEIVFANEPVPGIVRYCHKSVRWHLHDLNSGRNCRSGAHWNRLALGNALYCRRPVRCCPFALDSDRCCHIDDRSDQYAPDIARCCHTSVHCQYGLHSVRSHRNNGRHDEKNHDREPRQKRTVES